MTDLEKVLLRQNLINTKLNLIIMQQNTIQTSTLSSVLFSVQLLLDKVASDYSKVIDIPQSLSEIATGGEKITESIKLLHKDLVELNSFIDSIDDGSGDLSKFKFSLN